LQRSRQPSPRFPPGARAGGRRVVHAEIRHPRRLTGDPATSGQASNEAAKLGIEQVAAAAEQAGLDGVEVVLTDSQDSQGSPQPGVEGAQKLVQIDGVDVIIGDFYSSVTSAVVTAVTMPNQVLVFTGGTSPALRKLNTSQPALLWQPVPADDVQGRVLAQIIAEELGADAKINVAARNDAYGTALSAVFEEALDQRRRHDP
jgi:branched-chain amino acid transport system substrate-binding protein